MATSSKLKAISAQYVQSNLFRFFHNMNPVMQFGLDTDLADEFGYDDDAWANLADAINAQSWMQAINVQLAPGDMRNNRTMRKLIAVIIK